MGPLFVSPKSTSVFVVRIALAAGVCLSFAAGFAADEDKATSREKTLTIEYFHRSLSAENAELMVKAVIGVLNRDLDEVERQNHITRMGKIHHSAVLPALEAMLHQEKESWRIRVTAIKTIAVTPDERSFDILVEHIDDRDEMVQLSAESALCLLTRYYPYGAHRSGLVPTDPERRKKLKETWKKWRKDNAGKALHWLEAAELWNTY